MLPDGFFDPIAIAGEELGDWPDDDGRGIIAVKLGDAGDECVGLIEGGLEQGRDLADCLDLVLPAID